MPEKRTIKRARKDKREGKSASTQAGEFVREEMENMRKRKRGARSTKQAIAIGLSEARRTGIALKPPKGAKKTRKSATSASRRAGKPISRARSAAKRKAASPRNISRTMKAVAKKRGAKSRSMSTKRAAATRKRVKAKA